MDEIPVQKFGALSGGMAEKYVENLPPGASKYEPKVAEMKFEGEVLYIANKKQAEEIMKGWKKDKSIPKEMMAPILNTALTKCNIQALFLSQQVNLPPPVPLPKLKDNK